MRGERIDGPGAAALDVERRRMPHEDRTRLLLDQATQFFAAHGFDASIADLAGCCGVSQALIFKYFGSRENLIDQVYESALIGRWRDEWSAVVADRRRPLGERLIAFYSSFLETTDNSVWIRLAMRAGLDGADVAGRYMRDNLEPLLTRIAVELHAERGDMRDGAPGRREIEEVWALHAAVVFYLVRTDVFDSATAMDRECFVRTTIERFMQARVQSVGA